MAGMPSSPAKPVYRGPTKREVLAVAIGGLIGTGCRLAIDAALPHAGHAFPWSTFLTNLLGALVLGWLVGGLWKVPGVPRWVRAGVGAGVLGSFTTFSAVMVSLVGMSTSGVIGETLVYLLLSVVLGLGAATLGLRLGTLEAHRRMPRGISDQGETL